jgi:hypothetical protein
VEEEVEGGSAGMNGTVKPVFAVLITRKRVGWLLLGSENQKGCEEGGVCVCNYDRGERHKK